jgi:hypothetical protein
MCISILIYIFKPFIIIINRKIKDYIKIINFLLYPIGYMDTSDESNKGFFKHVFNFDDDSKSEILNIIQYALIAIIPIIVLNKTIGKYVPESDDKKSSLEVSAEIIIQIIVTFMGLLIIHRIITFIPTYSKTKYPDFNIVYIILAILMITMSLQTKLGEKVNILVERIMDLWNGTPDKKKNAKGKNGTVKVSQPISGQITGQMMNNAAMNQAMYTDGTAISSLPTNDVQYGSEETMQPQQLPNYNAMYRQDNTPLVGAATPGQTESMGPMEPMAANSVLGGGFGSAW